jgi:hypothetical protein
LIGQKYIPTHFWGASKQQNFNLMNNASTVDQIHRLVNDERLKREIESMTVTLCTLWRIQIYKYDYYFQTNDLTACSLTNFDFL